MRSAPGDSALVCRRRRRWRWPRIRASLLLPLPPPLRVLLEQQLQRLQARVQQLGRSGNCETVQQLHGSNASVEVWGCWDTASHTIRRPLFDTKITRLCLT